MNILVQMLISLADRKDKKRSELDGSLEGSHSDLDVIRDTSDKSSDDSESPVLQSNNTHLVEALWM